MLTEEKIRKSILTIFRYLDFIKSIYRKSRDEKREYLLIFTDNKVEYYRGEEHEVSIDPLKKFDPESVLAVLHTHPLGNPAPSAQDIAVADSLAIYSFLSIHGIVTPETLTLYNHYTIDSPTLVHMVSNNKLPPLSDEDRLRLSGAITVRIDPFPDIIAIPEIIEHFLGWKAYWDTLLYDTVYFDFSGLREYNALKRNALFIHKGRDIVEWLDGKKEAEIYWWIAEINEKRGTGLFYKVYEFVYENRPYKAVLQSYGDTTDVDNIKALDMIQECRKRKLCRVVQD